MSGHEADIRAHIGVAMEARKGIKVRGTVLSLSEDQEDAMQVVVEIKMSQKEKKRESGYTQVSAFSYSIPKRLVGDLNIGDEIVITLTRQ